MRGTDKKSESVRQPSTLGAGARHIREEFGRWWRAEDLTDAHIAHRLLNDQFKLWRNQRMRRLAEMKAHVQRLDVQQKRAVQAQLQGRGYGPSPTLANTTMRWSQQMAQIEAQEFRHVEVTPHAIAAGYGQVRSRRHLTAAGTVLGVALLWVGLWAVSAVAALAVAGLAGIVLLVLALVQGRRPTRRRPALPKLLFVPPEPPEFAQLDDQPEPFPIREAGRDPRRAREAITLALAKERAQIADVSVPEQTDWGWSAPLVLSGGTIADLIRVLPRVCTTLRVGQNRVLARGGNSEDSAAVELRILTSDPFAEPLPYPVRAPRSCSIKQPVSLGLSIEGETTPAVLAGQHVLIVADSGGGKSSMVRALAEYATACSDAVVVDVDPTGRGLGPLRSCAAERAYTPQDAEQVMERLHARATGRITAMGDADDNWPVTEDSPAVIVFCDEFPHMTAAGKARALDLLRIGRKARITLVVCSQDATSDVMGDAVADAFGIRILMPCRAADVPLVVGRADAIGQGWLPHLLVPSPGEWEIADAGRFYCVTPRHRSPILRYVSPLDARTAAERARERVAAGLPSLDSPAASAVPASAPEILRLLRAAFAAEADPEALTVAQLAERLREADPQTWGRWDGRRDRLAMVGRTIRTQLKKAGCELPTVRLDDEPGRPTAYRLDALQRALS